MFKIMYDVYRDGISVCHLVDDDFEEETPYTRWVAAIIYVYSKRNLPVLPNLLKYFDCECNSSRARRLIHNILAESNHHYPELKFKEKYYPCLMNQIKKLEFIGK